MPYWDHKGETQGIASPLCGSYNKGKMPGLSCTQGAHKPKARQTAPPPDCPKSAFSEVVESGVL